MPTCLSPVYAVMVENIRRVRERELARMELLQLRNVELREQVEGLRNIVQERENQRTRRERRRFGVRGGVFRVYIEGDENDS